MGVRVSKNEGPAQPWVRAMGPKGWCHFCSATSKEWWLGESICIILLWTQLLSLPSSFSFYIFFINFLFYFIKLYVTPKFMLFPSLFLYVSLKWYFFLLIFKNDMINHKIKKKKNIYIYIYDLFKISYILTIDNILQWNYMFSFIREVNVWISLLLFLQL